MPARNASLSQAKRAKKDEFYTQLSDIESELMHYREHFRGKVVLCNCDDPFESNFFKYFVLNFNHLGLKRLIATCYVGSPISGTQLSLRDIVGNESKPGTPYKAVVNTVYDATGDGYIAMDDIARLFETGENELSILEGDGDFRSAECLALLDEADIAATNPPFSLFRTYVAALVERGKDFIIIGSKNAITYKEFFPLLKNGLVWIGYGFTNGNSYFKIPSENAREFADGVYDEATGLVHFRNVTWFTNLDHRKRHEELILWRRYSPDEYPRYDNYDAIEVGKTSEIPIDYRGVMGVPITFLDKYCPEQFEIVGLLQSSTEEQAGIPILREYSDFREMRQDMTFTGASGKKANGNPVLKGKSKKGNFLYNEHTNEYVHSAYARICIRYTDQWIAEHPEDFKEE